jgi:HSP20 family protein
VVVQVELAGADPDSLTVSADDVALYIAGSRLDRSDACRGLSILQKEIEYGEFVKKIPLPGEIDVDAATANYSDGILTITLPLSARERRVVGSGSLRATVRKISV